jgi:HEAT repeat protein
MKLRIMRIIMKNRFAIYAIVLLSIIFSFAGQGFCQEASGSVFAEAKKLMREGRFIDAHKLVSASIHDGEDKNRAEGFLATTRYAQPDWDPADVSELEKTKLYSIPLIIDIAAQDPPQGAGMEQAEWIVNAKVKFISALGIMKYDKAIPMLTKLSDSRDARIRFISLKALANMKNAAANKAIYDYLMTEHLPDYRAGNTNQQLALENQTRAIAIGTLAEARDASLEAELARKVKERKSADRMTAAIILTGYRSPRYVELYQELLKEDDPALKLYAAAALKDMGYNDGFTVLRDMFEKVNPSQKISLLNAIAYWGNQESAKFMIDHLEKQSSNKKIGYAPVNMLGKIPVISSQMDPQSYLYTLMVQNLIDGSSSSAPVLLEILKNGKNENISYFAAEILGEAKDKQAKELFVKNLDSKDPLSVYYAIFALGRMKDKKSAEKFTALLSSANPNISAAAAWGLAKMGDPAGRMIAVKNLNSKDPALASIALDTLFLLKNPGDAALAGAAMKKGLTLTQDFITALRLLGIAGDPSQIEVLRMAAAEALPISFYGAESIYRITGVPTKFNAPELSQDDLRHYGAGIYDMNSYTRYILLYMTLDPGKFGKLNEVKYGYITPLRRYGEFGKVEDKSPANPIMAESGVGQTGKPAGELQPGQTVVVRKSAGNKALVSLTDGSSGWTFLAGMDTADDVIASTSQRLRKDLGFRRKEDLEEILKNDYLKKAAFNVEHTNPKETTNAEMALFALDMGERLSGGVNVDSRNWDEIISGIDTGKRIVTVDKAIKNEKWIFTFDAAGNLESIKN